MHIVCGGELLRGGRGSELGHLHALPGGDVHVGRGSVCIVSCGDKLAGGERRSFRLHLCCGVHGGIGRSGVHDVSRRDVQDKRGDRDVRLCVSFWDKLTRGERRSHRLHLRGGLHGGI